METTKIALFKGKQIRKVTNNNEWWFLVIDVVGVLTDSANPADYIKKMRVRDAELAKGWGQIVTPLLLATGGGAQRTNCANNDQ
jgi:DNA-damage-inducible protein D